MERRLRRDEVIKPGRCVDPVLLQILLKQEEEDDIRRAARADRDTIAEFQREEALLVRPGGGLTIGETNAMAFLSRGKMRVPDHYKVAVRQLVRMHYAEACDRPDLFTLTPAGEDEWLKITRRRDRISRAKIGGAVL